MSSPSATRRALGLDDPLLQEAFPLSISAAKLRDDEKADAVVQASQQFRMHWAGAEREVKEWMTTKRLRSMLGGGEFITARAARLIGKS